MADSGQPGATLADPQSGIDPGESTGPGALIEALRARGAERFDRVGWRFIEALSRRAAAHRDHSRRLLDRRLAEALAEYGERFDRAEREARDTLVRAAEQFPEAAPALRQRWAAGDFRGLHRLLARLEARGGSDPLAGLLAEVGRHTSDGELKALSRFRGTWSRLHVDRQLSRAFARTPENAGPLNSHFLVLRALRLMRDISPEYLEQFLSYLDAMLWLDQAASDPGPVRMDTPVGEARKKRKSGRAKPR